MAIRDRLEHRRTIESSGMDLANRELHPRPDGFEIDDPARTVRAFVVFESALQPQTVVAAADRRAGRVDAAPAFGALVFAIDSRRLRELVDTKHRAARGARAAASFRGTPGTLGIGGELGHEEKDRKREGVAQTSAPDGPPVPKKTRSERSSVMSLNSCSVSAGT